jgi:hypothetical protein
MLAPPSSAPPVRIVAALRFIGSGLILTIDDLDQLFADIRQRLV